MRNISEFEGYLSVIIRKHYFLDYIPRNQFYLLSSLGIFLSVSMCVSIYVCVCVLVSFVFQCDILASYLVSQTLFPIVSLVSRNVLSHQHLVGLDILFMSCWGGVGEVRVFSEVSNKCFFIAYHYKWLLGKGLLIRIPSWESLLTFSCFHEAQFCGVAGSLSLCF